MRSRAALPLALFSLVLGLGAVAPAEATGGPPRVTSVLPDPISADGTLTVTGEDCDPASPVSFRLFPTDTGTQFEVHSADSGVTADGTGAFTHAIPLAGHFTPGTQFGVVAVCAPIFTETGMSNAGADDSYVFVSLSDPTVDVSIVAQAVYGSRPTVHVTTSVATGSIVVRLDGTQIYSSSTGEEAHSVQLPATLSLGAHTLVAEFDPTVEGAATVTDSATVKIVKAPSTATLSRAGKKRVKVGKKVKLTLVLASVLDRVGEVVIKDGRKVRATIMIEATDNGTKTFKVRLPKKGKRKLTAHFAGSAYVLPSSSPKVIVKVVKPS